MLDDLRKRKAQALEALGEEPEFDECASRWRSAREALEEYFGFLISLYLTDELMQKAEAAGVDFAQWWAEFKK